MLEFTGFAVLLLSLGIWDIRSMLKNKKMKELIPYIIIGITAIVIAFIEFRNPYREGIANFLLRLIHSKS